MDANAFLLLAAFVTHRTARFDSHEEHVQFRETFGVLAYVCAIAWGIHTSQHLANLPPGSQPIHILWTLLFLRQYPTGRIMEALTHASRPTICRLVWGIIYC